VTPELVGKMAAMTKSALSTKQVQRMLATLKGKLPSWPGLREVAEAVRSGKSVGDVSVRKQRAQLRAYLTRGTLSAGDRPRVLRDAATLRKKGPGMREVRRLLRTPNPIEQAQRAAVRGRARAAFPDAEGELARSGELWRGGSVGDFFKRKGSAVSTSPRPRFAADYVGPQSAQAREYGLAPSDLLMRLKDVGARHAKRPGEGRLLEQVIPMPAPKEYLDRITGAWRSLGGKDVPISKASLKRWAEAVGAKF
jgi:hypothetical protein